MYFCTYYNLLSPTDPLWIRYALQVLSLREKILNNIALKNMKVDNGA